MITVKEAIKEMGLDRMEVALKMKVSFETVRKWERDNRIPEGPAKILFWRFYDEFSKNKRFS